MYMWLHTLAKMIDVSVFFLHNITLLSLKMNIGFMYVVQVMKYNLRSRHCSNFSKKPPWNVLFFGTDEFSVYSLKALYREYKNGSILKRLEVVTTTKRKLNPVKIYADQHKLLVHSWPVVELPKNTFDVGLVVSFGHLIPHSIIQQFQFGMLNVHASLLPRWRGAAPIIYALANGDKETGVTIMKIRPKQFDIGELLLQMKIPISNDLKLPMLHETLGNLGARCLVDCLQNLSERLQNAKPQPRDGVTYAPKLTQEFTVVRWEEMSSVQIYNLERAVTSLLPLISSWNGISVKLVGVRDCTICETTSNEDDQQLLKPGFVKFDKQSKTLRVKCANKTWISVEKIGVFGKKLISAIDFNNGYVKKEPLEKRYFK